LADGYTSSLLADAGVLAVLDSSRGWVFLRWVEEAALPGSAITTSAGCSEATFLGAGDLPGFFSATASREDWDFLFLLADFSSGTGVGEAWTLGYLDADF